MPVGNRSSQSPRGPRSLREDLLGQSWMTGLILPGLQTHFPISGLPAWLSRCAPVPWAEPIRAGRWSEWYPGRGCVWGDSAEPPMILSIPAAGGKIILPRKIQVCVFCSCLEAAGWIFAERLLKIICLSCWPQSCSKFAPHNPVCVTTDRLGNTLEVGYRQTLHYDL